MRYDERMCGIPLADFAARMNTDLSSSSPSSLQGIATTSLVSLIWLNEKHKIFMFLNCKISTKMKKYKLFGRLF